MKESEGKRKEAATAERFLLNFINKQKESFSSVWLVGFYSQPIIQITKNYKSKH